ncbi:PDR/VanB family oxidoreductase [Methylobacterium aquaticum]|uniref:Vanillate O-demethylase oxidoreductase n=1 Tax=Methylobacterium aquaticum TaxID=270351 RepID=A0A0J6S752_9HYPH|nr:PDR/VanB family oxidoreductase [Methylobacterium aquaticum]KMO29529.1 Vanillate O-demethylase oxidoreductase [Methylobacterium aquaticum]
MTETSLRVEIADRRQAAEDIIVLDLIPVEGTTLPPFEPGAHVDVEIGPDLVRQYSLCGDPSRTDRYRLGILLDPASRGGSAGIHAQFQVGRRVTISAPRNNFPLASAAATVLVGGGIGITPLLAMAHHLHAVGLPFRLHYCARARAKAAFLAELAEAPYADSVQLHFDDGGPDQRLDPSRDFPAPSEGAHLYVCGPTGFMDWVIGSATKLGYPDAQVHKEYFGAEVDASGGAFEVELSRSGRVVPVAAGQSIVAALKTVGMRVEVSCEQGVCGTCLCDVLEGVPDHRDSYLTDDEKGGNDQMMLCCSRAKTPRLVLDL